MYKTKIFLGAALSALLLAGLAHAGLTTIGTATYIGKDYNLIWDDDNNGNSVVWFDYTKEPREEAWPFHFNEISGWASNLDGYLTYNINPAYNVTWEANWRLPNTLDDDDESKNVYSYDGSTQFGYNNTYNEMGHLFYEELGNSGEYDESGNPIVDFGLQNFGDFDFLRESRYWTGTPFYGWSDFLYTFDFHTGLQDMTDDANRLSGLTLRNAQITISNLPPVVAITSPMTGSSLNKGETVTFSGTATDNEDRSLSSFIEWSSSIDGSLGTGLSLNSALSLGTHTITASVTDSGGLNSTSSVTITVTVAGFIDSDSDNIDDNWEKMYAPGGDLNYFGAGDKDGDGYSDFDEYLNRLLVDSAGNIYDPGEINEPYGPGYAPPGSNTAFLPKIYFLLLNN